MDAAARGVASVGLLGVLEYVVSISLALAPLATHPSTPLESDGSNQRRGR